MLRKTFLWALLMMVCFAVLTAAAQMSDPAQTPTSQASQAQTPANLPRVQHPGGHNGPKPPDMVCFGYYPSWSLQFGNGEARYLASNEPDQTFLGDFYWVPGDNVWEWHRANGLATTGGGYGLSASIQKESCNDTVRNTTYPYSASVYLPQGDMVSGCCRKLLPGEAPIGRHGLPSSAPVAKMPGQPQQAQ